MDDLISKQVVLDEISKLRRSQQMLDDTQSADLVMHGMYLVEKAIEKLPSTQPDFRSCLDLAIKIACPLESLGLSVMCYNSLLRWGITSVHGLLVAQENGELKKIRGIGKKAIMEIEHALQEFIGDENL